MHRPLVSRLLFIVVLLGALLPQTPLWAMPRAQNAPDAPDSFALQIPLTDAVQISAGGDFNCILTNKASVKCWGANYAGQLGDGTEVDRLTPANVVGLGSGVKAIAAGTNHACALLTGGGIKCWGDNSGGQIGDGASGTNHLTPVAVSDITNAVAISTAESHSCALLNTGGNTEGQIGDGTSGTNRLTPVAVSDITNAVAISTGRFNSCAVLATGGLQCWGGNDSGQIGDSTQGTDRLTPTDVSGLGSGVKAVTVSEEYTCALLTNGNVKCWGIDGLGQLGNGSPAANSATPVDVYSLEARGDGEPIGVSAISAGGSHTCALINNGSVKCWGKNLYGELGDGISGTGEFDGSENRPTPIDVTGLKNAIAISAGASHTCALLSSGGVQCWGSNDRGQLGDNTYLSKRALPADVTVPATCFVLTLSHSGSGSNPAPTPSQSPGCPASSYLAGTLIALVSAPAANNFVQGWSGTNNNSSHDPANLLTMPAADRALKVTYAPCRALTITHSGDGGNATAVPSQSTGCPASKYAAGENIALVAAPAADRFVQSWSGTSSDESRDFANHLTMPNADLSVSVTYGLCRTLTTSHSGSGGNPVAIPGHSTQCTSGKYTPNEIIALLATPADNARVKSWTGAAQSPADGSVNNTLAMPDANTAVSVKYEACVALTAAIEGQGTLLQMTPTATFGCDPSSFVAGQTVTLLAAPANGWHVVSWSGTTNNQSSAVSNSVVIGSEATQVGILYAKDATPKSDIPLFLPNITN